MSWTYVDPTKSAKDAVRLMIGDTDQCDQLLQDVEIQYFLNQYNQSVYSASIRCCEVIMGKFTRMANEAVGSVRIDFSQKSKQYQVMVAQLRARLAIDGDLQPYAGGISKTDKNMETLDSDRVKPDFTKHMDENTRIAPRTSSEGDLLDRLLPDDDS